MEIREKLRVTAEEFFSQMMVSVLYDIKSGAGRRRADHSDGI